MVPLYFFVIDVSYKRTSFSTTYKFEFCIPQLPWPQCALRCGIFKEWNLYCFGVIYFLQVKKKRKKTVPYIFCVSTPLRGYFLANSTLFWSHFQLSHNHILKISEAKCQLTKTQISSSQLLTQIFLLFNCCLNFSGSICLCFYRS